MRRYAKGNTKNVIATSVTSPSFAMFGNSGVCLSERRLWCDHRRRLSSGGAGGDGWHPADRSLRRYAVRFNHNWDPDWSTSLFGSYSGVRYDGGERQHQGRIPLPRAPIAQLHGTTGQAVVGISRHYTCNPDFNVSQLGVVTRWTPVKNLTFSAEFQWFHLDQKMSGQFASLRRTAPKPTALLRVQGPEYRLAAASRSA